MPPFPGDESPGAGCDDGVQTPSTTSTVAAGNRAAAAGFLEMRSMNACS